jgi:hypothetical protein
LEKEQTLWNSAELDDATITQFCKEYDVDFNSIYANFDMGINFFINDSDMDDVSNKCNRFAPPSSELEMDQLIKQTESKATRKNTTWSMKIFDDWRSTRNNCQGVAFSDVIPALHIMTAEQINAFLSQFVMEVRKADGTEYPGKTIYLIISGLQRHLRESGFENMNVLDEKDVRFNKFR